MASASGERVIKVALVDVDGTLHNNDSVFRNLSNSLFPSDDDAVPTPFNYNPDFSYNENLIIELKKCDHVFLVSDRDLKTIASNLNSLDESLQEQGKAKFNKKQQKDLTDKCSIKTIYNHVQTRLPEGTQLKLVSKHTELNRISRTDEPITDNNICTQAFETPDDFKDNHYLVDNPAIYTTGDETFPDWMLLSNGNLTTLSKYPRFYAIIDKLHKDHPNARFDLNCYDDTPNNLYQFHLAVAYYKIHNPDHRINSAYFHRVYSHNFHKPHKTTLVPITEDALEKELSTIEEGSRKANTIPKEIAEIVRATLKKPQKIPAAASPAAASPAPAVAAAAVATPAVETPAATAAATASAASSTAAPSASPAVAVEKTPAEPTNASFIINALKTIAKVLFNLLLIASGIGIIPLAIQIKKTGRAFFFDGDSSGNGNGNGNGNSSPNP